jgi:hypothetical protein
VRLVENLDQRPALMDAVDDRHAVDHAACGSVPLCHDEDVAGAFSSTGRFRILLPLAFSR